METSPLRFLDNDVSNILCKYVTDSQEEHSRKFHMNLLNATHIRFSSTQKRYDYIPHYDSLINSALKRQLTNLFNKKNQTIAVMKQCPSDFLSKYGWIDSVDEKSLW
jgi:hypothetical protein